MHPAVFQRFDAICRDRKVRGAVLEIGATPDASSLLNLPALATATRKVGVNMAGASAFADFVIHRANANTMPEFSDASFDAVLCNAVLEHDRFFWKTLAEIRRVTRPGGVVVIGTPGYAELRWEKRLRKWLSRLPRSPKNPDGWSLQHSTLTLGVHNFPGDYYRFSAQAFRDVFFEGMHDVVVESVLTPPRIIGSGVRM